MSARRSRRTAAAIVLAAAVTALIPGLANAATTAAHVAPAAPASKILNGTKGNGLTISDGSQWVTMNGTRVNFHTDVRDLAWNPAGTKAAFIDGAGNLETANPNGTDRVVVAKHLAGQTLSHPTWQVAAADKADEIAAKDNIIFVAATKGVDRLERIAATAHHGTPTLLPLNHYAGEGVTGLPQTGNTWPSAGGSDGTIVYANTYTGDVYIRDDYLRQQGGAVTKGFEPALSPNGEELVFVRSVNGHDHLFEENLTTEAVKDLTPYATTNYTEPAFSANGQAISFVAPSGIYTIPANGSHRPVATSAFMGLPAYRG
jgi:hypothetical protein